MFEFFCVGGFVVCVDDFYVFSLIVELRNVLFDYVVIIIVMVDDCDLFFELFLYFVVEYVEGWDCVVNCVD